MEKRHYKNSAGYSLVEMLAVLLIVSIIIIILSKTSVANYNKYKERLALNELVSDLYQLQTRSLNEENIYIYFQVMENMSCTIVIKITGKRFQMMGKYF